MCIHYFCSTCKAPFTGENAIETCAAQYTVAPDKRDHRVCPSKNIKWAKRGEGEHYNGQPCPGPPRYPPAAERAFARQRARWGNDDRYVRPGNLFNPVTQARAAVMFGQSHYGQSIARANEKGNNHSPNGTYTLYEAASQNTAEAIDGGKDGDIVAPDYERAAVDGRRQIAYTGPVKAPRQPRGKRERVGL